VITPCPADRQFETIVRLEQDADAAPKCHEDHPSIAENIQATFRRRGTHDVPASLPPPRANWEATFGEMAARVRFGQKHDVTPPPFGGFPHGVLK
jgi:hypothetical protein